MSDGPEWFAPKRYGYGAGLPISWHGWALTIGFLALVIGLSLRFCRPAAPAHGGDGPDHGGLHRHLRESHARRLALALGRGGLTSRPRDRAAG